MSRSSLESIFSTLPFSHHVFGISSFFISQSQIQDYFSQHFHDAINLQFFDYEKLSIDDVRKLKALGTVRGEEQRMLVIQAQTIDPLSQNALLKLFEEPAKGVYFILLYPHIQTLLATLRSRMYVVTGTDLGADKGLNIDDTKTEPFLSAHNTQNIHINFDELLAMTLSERFTWVKKNTTVAKNKTTLSRHDVDIFLGQVEQWLLQQGRDTQSSVLFQVVIDTRAYNQKNSSSVKMLFDLVLGYLPVVKNKR